jgi:cellulose synthase/poly-beta-1,6-N-acetylglucosamine synthase-like glycosyltransferase
MDELAQARNPVEIFRVYWAGKGRLSGAYWKYGVAGTLGLYVFAMLGSLMLFPAALKGHESVLESPIFRAYLLVVYLLLLAYQVVVWALIWRNARNVQNPVWGHVAKVAVVGGAFLFLVRVFGTI